MTASAPSPAQPPPAQPHGIVASAVYAQGKRLCDVPVAEAGAWTQKPGHFVWVGLYEPSAELLRDVQRQFDLHELAVEDALHAHQRPKLEVYGDTLFMALRTARLENDRVVFGETHIFAGCGFVVSVRHGASASYTPVRERCETSPRRLGNGEDYVLYAIMDFVVDNYMPVLDAIEAKIERMESKLLQRPPTPGEIETIHRTRRNLMRMRRAASPLLEICRRLELHDVPVIDPEMRAYFRDVHDHVIRVNETIDNLHELMSFAFEASMMLASARQNDVTRKLAAWAAILAVPTAIAGIYGMNFENMPELKWTYGYYGALAAIVVLCIGLYVRFKRTGWL